MSDQETLTEAGKGVGYLAGGGFLGWLVRHLLTRGAKAEAQVIADLRERITKLETTNEKIMERLNSALEKHAERIDRVEELATRTDERLRVYGHRAGEPMTNPGYQLSPELAAAIAQSQEPKP